MDERSLRALLDELPDEEEGITADEWRIALLEEALRFYANPHNYGIGGGSSNNILRDAGKIAKGALK